MHGRTAIGAMAILALLLVATPMKSGAFLKIAMEDVGDPAPRRFAVAMQIAGACIGFALSWSDRAGRRQ